MCSGVQGNAGRSGAAMWRAGRAHVGACGVGGHFPECLRGCGVGAAATLRQRHGASPVLALRAPARCHALRAAAC